MKLAKPDPKQANGLKPRPAAPPADASVTVTVRLPPPWARRLESLGAACGLTVRDLIPDLLRRVPLGRVLLGLEAGMKAREERARQLRKEKIP